MPPLTQEVAPEVKAFDIAEVKTIGEAGSGQFEAVMSVFGNVDFVDDIVHEGAFQKAITDQAPPPQVWSHKWEIPPIGETLDWAEKVVAVPGMGQVKGLWMKGALFVGADDNHQYADMCYAGMKSRDGRPPALKQYSFSYGVPDDGFDFSTVQGKTVRNLKTIFPVHEGGPCLRGANELTATVSPPKALVHAAMRKALGTEEAKTYDDIDSWAVYLLTEMIGDGSSFISNEQDAADVQRMRAILASLVEMLAAELVDEAADDGAEAKVARLVEVVTGRKLNETGIEKLWVPSIELVKTSMEAKAGRVLSGSNEERVRTALDGFSTAATALQDVLDSAGAADVVPAPVEESSEGKAHPFTGSGRFCSTCGLGSSEGKHAPPDALESKSVRPPGQTDLVILNAHPRH